MFTRKSNSSSNNEKSKSKSAPNSITSSEIHNDFDGITNNDNNNSMPRDNIYNGKVLWAKMKSYPWWPCMICKSPEGEISNSESTKVHVIYFGEDIQRSWINLKDTYEFKGIVEHRNHLSQLEANKNTKELAKYEIANRYKDKFTYAIDEAQEAFLMEIDERIEEYSIHYDNETEKRKQKINKKRSLKIERSKQTEIIENFCPADEKIEFEFQRLKAPVFSSLKSSLVCYLCTDNHQDNMFSTVISCNNKCSFTYHKNCMKIMFEYINSNNENISQLENIDMCIDCNRNVRRCYICMKTDNSSDIINCYMKDCNNYYHQECVRKSPINDYVLFKQNSNSKDSLPSCPSHVCRTCFIVEPKDVDTASCYKRCIMCYATFHCGDWCLPAGSVEINPLFIICPQHLPKSDNFDIYKAPFTECITEKGAIKLESTVSLKGTGDKGDLWQIDELALANIMEIQKKKRRVNHNVNWCMGCGQTGGLLVCCEKCPVAMHKLCCKIDSSVEKYICDHCEEGYYPRYGDILWVKFGQHRWWPCQVIIERNVPSNLFKSKHGHGQFCVQFFGDNSYCWTTRKHAYHFEIDDLNYHKEGVKALSYIEGKEVSDGAEQSESIGDLTAVINSDIVPLLTKTDKVYQKGVVIATRAVTKKIEKSEKLFKKHLKPQSYRHIRANIPVGEMKNKKKNTDYIYHCSCKPQDPDPCGPTSNCENRDVRVECLAGFCKAGTECKNRRFTTKAYPGQEIFYTKRCGWGLRATEHISAGRFVNEYVGELISYAEAKRRATERERKHDNHYMMQADKKSVIDASHCGNLSRFMNHSCDPNLHCDIWLVAGHNRVGIFAIRDIEPGEELCFKYNFTTFENVETECRCGSKKCCGKLSVSQQQKSTNQIEQQQQQDDNDSKSMKRKLSKSTKIGRPSKIAKVDKENVDDNKQNKSNKRSSPLKITQMSKEHTKIRKKNALKESVSNRNWDKNCFRCGKEGNCDVFCADKYCPRIYHRTCLDLKRDYDKSQWLCPWHFCDICGHISYFYCNSCTSSWCQKDVCYTIADLPKGSSLVDDELITKPPQSVDCSVHKITMNYLSESKCIITKSKLTSTTTSIMESDSNHSDSLSSIQFQY